jgi:hypothetical protein
LAEAFYAGDWAFSLEFWNSRSFTHGTEEMAIDIGSGSA